MFKIPEVEELTFMFPLLPQKFNEGKKDRKGKIELTELQL